MHQYLLLYGAILKFRFLDHLMARVFIGEFYWLSGIFRNDTGLNNGATNQKIAATFEVVSVEKVIRLNLCSLLPYFSRNKYRSFDYTISQHYLYNHHLYFE